MGDLPWLVLKGVFNLKNMDCRLVASFPQFSESVYFYHTDCAFMCLYYYIGASIKFPKFEHGQKVMNVQSFFLHFDYGDFLT